MAKILVASWGSPGDNLPYLGIGWELQKRGHDVTLIANPHFEPHAAGAGLSFHPVGLAADYRRLLADRGLWQWKTGPARVAEHALPAVEPYYEAIVALHEPGRTVLVASVAVYAARLAQEAHGIPLASVLHSPKGLSSRHDPPHPDRPLPAWAEYLARTRKGLSLLYRLRDLRRRRAGRPRGVPPAEPPLVSTIGRLRSRLDLPRIRQPFCEWCLSPQRVICTWPNWFADRQSDWPRQAVVTGFPFYPPPGSEAAEDAGPPKAANGSKPIVFTTGSVACCQREFFATAVDTCKLLNRPGVLVSPHADDIPPQLPPEVAHVEYAPFARLFARSAAVVHHGGIGTTACALAAGVPQVARPMMGGQYDISHRMQRLGVGRMLCAEHPRPAQLARVIQRLLTSSHVSNRCKHWQSRIDPQSGLARSADWIERLAESSCA